MSPEFPQYLDGPKFIAYLQSEGVEKHNLIDSEKRRWQDWKDGGRADLYSECVDGLLARYGINADRDIPKDVWHEDQSHNRGRASKGKGRVKRKPSRPQREARKAKGIKMLLDGEPIPYITAKLGLGSTTAYKWRKELRQAGLLTDSEDLIHG